MEVCASASARRPETSPRAFDWTSACAGRGSFNFEHGHTAIWLNQRSRSGGSLREQDEIRKRVGDKRATGC